jgi:hypothetical protein
MASAIPGAAPSGGGISRSSSRHFIRRPSRTRRPRPGRCGQADRHRNAAATSLSGTSSLLLARPQWDPQPPPTPTWCPPGQPYSLEPFDETWLRGCPAASGVPASSAWAVFVRLADPGGGGSHPGFQSLALPPARGNCRRCARPGVLCSRGLLGTNLRSVRIGVKPGQWEWSCEDLQTSWRVAEEAGFGVISCFDHVTASPAGLAAWDAPSLLTAMAGVTERAALAVDVVNISLRHGSCSLRSSLSPRPPRVAGSRWGLALAHTTWPASNHSALALRSRPLNERCERGWRGAAGHSRRCGAGKRSPMPNSALTAHHSAGAARQR